MKLFRCVCPILFLIAASAQNLLGQDNDRFKGYYFTEKMDSVGGYFDIAKLREGSISFSKTVGTDGPKRKLLPGDVSSVVGENGIRLFSKTIKTGEEAEQIFAKQLTGSEIKLYEGISTVRGTVFFLGSPEHPDPVRIGKRGIKATFEAMFPGCGYEKPVSYNRTSLLNILNHYQQCRYGGKVVDISRENRLRVAVGLKFVAAQAYQSSPYKDQFNRGEYFFKTGGAKGQLWFSKNLALELELIYRRTPKMVGDSYRVEYSFTSTFHGQDFTIDKVFRQPAATRAHFVQVPIGFRANFLDEGDFQMFLAVKGSAMFKVFQRTRFTGDETYYGEGHNFEPTGHQPTYFTQNRSAFILETGLRKPVGKSSAVEFGLFYSWDSMTYRARGYGINNSIIGEYFRYDVRVRTHFLGASMAFTNWVPAPKRRKKS